MSLPFGLREDILSIITGADNPKASAKSKDYDLKCVLSCLGNHGGLVQEKRPKGASQCG